MTCKSNTGKLNELTRTTKSSLISFYLKKYSSWASENLHIGILETIVFSSKKQLNEVDR